MCMSVCVWTQVCSYLCLRVCLFMCVSVYMYLFVQCVCDECDCVSSVLSVVWKGVYCSGLFLCSGDQGFLFLTVFLLFLHFFLFFLLFFFSVSLWVLMGAGTIRKAQNLLKQYSQHGLDGKKGSNLTPLEGKARALSGFLPLFSHFCCVFELLLGTQQQT